MLHKIKSWVIKVLEPFYFNTLLPYMSNMGFILYGKGGGGSKSAPAPTNQTVTQTNLPEYARPYFENLLNRSQALSYQGYRPYHGPYVQGYTRAIMGGLS